MIRGVFFPIACNNYSNLATFTRLLHQAKNPRNLKLSTKVHGTLAFSCRCAKYSFLISEKLKGISPSEMSELLYCFTKNNVASYKPYCKSYSYHGRSPLPASHKSNVWVTNNNNSIHFITVEASRNQSCSSYWPFFMQQLSQHSI